jgi:hypothetical protein
VALRVNDREMNVYSVYDVRRRGTRHTLPTDQIVPNLQFFLLSSDEESFEGREAMDVPNGDDVPGVGGTEYSVKMDVMIVVVFLTLNRRLEPLEFRVRNRFGCVFDSPRR